MNRVFWLASWLVLVVISSYVMSYFELPKVETLAYAIPFAVSICCLLEGVKDADTP